MRHQNLESCALLPQMATDLRTVYVGNLTVAADEKALRSVFETCGEVTQVRLAGCAAQQCCLVHAIACCFTQWLLEHRLQISTIQQLHAHL